MSKTILITGATDGIGLIAAQQLTDKGHTVLLHGRNREKLAAAAADLPGNPPTYLADLADLSAVKAMAEQITSEHPALDVLVNNAGVLKTPKPILDDGKDIRFVVNTVAPYLLARLLLPTMGEGARIVNLSSAAQAAVDLEALAGRARLDDMAAYSQSKLAITMWSRALAEELRGRVTVLAVNPGSLLATKMVREGFNFAGHDITIGSNIIERAATDSSFDAHSGEYYDNDAKRFAPCETSGLDAKRINGLMAALDVMIADFLG